MGDIKNTYLKFVPFSIFKLWDVKRYNTKLGLLFENIASLDDILIPYRKQVTKGEMIRNGWRIISKINFGGQLFLREFDEINTYKGNLNLVPGNAIIYSKINVRHGCIYYHPKGSIPFGVSSEYPTYTFDETKINGFFLQMVLRSNGFKNLINTKTSGISKARVKQNEFLDIQIPLPSLVEQEQIVTSYNQKLEQAKNLEEEADTQKLDFEKHLFEVLEIELISNNSMDKNLLKFIKFTHTERWDSLFLLGNLPYFKSKYRLLKFKDVITNFNKDKQGKSLRVDSTKQPNDDFRYIGMEHIQKESGRLLEMPMVKGKEIKSQTINVPKDYFIYGKLRPYLNKYWINNLDYDNIICSSEFFVFDITDQVNKQFFQAVLASKIIQQQIVDKTSGARMPRINEDTFFDLQFPFPPKEIQDKIADHITKTNAIVIAKRVKAVILKVEAEKEFEQAIFKN